jgi:hypothetical protein
MSFYRLQVTLGVFIIFCLVLPPPFISLFAFSDLGKYERDHFASKGIVLLNAPYMCVVL